MAPKSSLKDCFEIESKFGAFYTGGKVRWSDDGETLYCGATDVINVLDVSSGTVKYVLGTTDDERPDQVLCFAISGSGNQLVSAHRSGLFKLWNTSDGTLIKTWKSIHKGPISEVAMDKQGSLLASGGTDGVVRIWDLNHHSCTAALRGAQGVISVVIFSENEDNISVFACGDDLNIYQWDINSGKVISKLNGHYSKVTGLAIHRSGRYLTSCARDKVLILWDLVSGDSLKTVAVNEALEGIEQLAKKIELPELGEIKGDILVATAGEKGYIRIFEMKSGREIYVQNNSVVSKNEEEGGLSVVQLLFNSKTNMVALVTADHNIVVHHLNSFKCYKQLIGYSDEILDVVFIGREESHLAVATNSKDIKLYNLANQGCQLLRGHTDFVLCLAVSPANPNLMISAGKDSTVRFWEFDLASEVMNCVTVANRHTASVTCLAFASLAVDTFLSASLDTTLKLWKREGDGIIAQTTAVAHDNDINCVTMAPNDKLIATASQDKTAKLWDADDLSLLGVLSGHRRGVWCVRFSPIDQVILTSSADCTIKLWTITDLSCLKTLEGHESSVLRAEFMSRGMQILSCSGDGLLKLWTIKSSECIGTFEGHDGKVWTMAVNKAEDKVVTGGTDSRLLVWKDTTEEKKLIAQMKRDELLLQEQELSNLLISDRLLEALALALDLDRPFKVLNIIKDLGKRHEKEALFATLASLTPEQKQKLLECASAWNCNAKHSASAQLVISAFLDELATGLLTMPNLSSYVEEVLPYTERHFKRLTETLKNLHFINFTIQKMNPAL